MTYVSLNRIGCEPPQNINNITLEGPNVYFASPDNSHIGFASNAPSLLTTKNAQAYFAIYVEKNGLDSWAINILNQLFTRSYPNLYLDCDLSVSASYDRGMNLVQTTLAEHYIANALSTSFLNFSNVEWEHMNSLTTKKNAVTVPVLTSNSRPTGLKNMNSLLEKNSKYQKLLKYAIQTDSCNKILKIICSFLIKKIHISQWKNTLIGNWCQNNLQLS